MVDLEIASIELVLFGNCHYLVETEESFFFFGNTKPTRVRLATKNILRIISLLYLKKRQQNSLGEFNMAN